MAWQPFRNVSLKVSAVALGTLLWFTVGGRQIERRLSVPVSYSNVRSPLELTGDQVDSVGVNVRGAESVVSAIRDGDVRVVVNLAEAHEGTNPMALGADEVVAPLGVEVLQIEPGTVLVSLERAGQINVVVNPTIEGAPAPGFEIRSTTVQPRTVTVSGPESRLRESATVFTERIVVNGRTTTLTRDVGVGVADARLRVLPPHTVRVTVEIVPGKGER
jgi:YbbR domain-containing protein